MVCMFCSNEGEKERITLRKNCKEFFFFLLEYIYDVHIEVCMWKCVSISLEKNLNSLHAAASVAKPHCKIFGSSSFSTLLLLCVPKSSNNNFIF